MGHRGVASLVLWGVFAILEPQKQKQQCSAFSFSAPRAVFERRPNGNAAPPCGRKQQPKRSNVRGIGCAPSHANTLLALSGRLVASSAAPRGRGIGELQAQEVGIGLRQTEEQEDEGFQWARQWYPVAVMRDLEARDPRQPYPVKLLGEALVVWKDPTDGSWKAFADRCPHRWAPLSEGRVNQESGRLHCIYHGWEFQGDGKCGSIPQATPESREVAQNSKRACATVIPIKIVEGKLWLWPDSSPEGVKESEVVEPVTVPGVDFDSGEFGGQWYARDLSYGVDTLIENLVDPAHVPYAHHGVIGSRAMGTPMAIAIDEEALPGKDEFVTGWTGYGGRSNMRIGFRAPSLIYYETDYTETLDATIKRFPPAIRAMYWAIKKLNIDENLSMKDEDRKEKRDRLLSYFVGYAVPTSPGQCRIFSRNPRNFFLQHPVIPRRFRNSIAKEHLAQHLVLDGDSQALHVQERSLAAAGEQGIERPERVFYMPTASDVGVRRFRKWYNSRGGSGPSWAQGVDPSDLGPTLPHERTLDRMAHTKECAACGKAFRVSEAVKRIAVGGTVFLLGAAAAIPRGLLPLGLAGGALASAGLAVAMAKRQQKFVFVDYVHARRD